MKKIYYLRLWLIAAMLSVAYSASAYDAYVDGVYYDLNKTERTAKVTYSSYSPYDNRNAYVGAISIPSVFIYDGIKYTVTSIGDYAFQNCGGLTSVTIPNSVTNIGENAFSGCSGLKEVHISDLAAWCRIDFDCSSSNPCGKLYLNGELITDLVIPNSVTSIGDYAFHGCSGLTSVIIPNSVTEIGYSAFYGCSGLTSVTIPNSVTSIGGSAFRDCSSLTSVSIPNSVTEIHYDAFYGCKGLKEVHISDLEAWCRIEFYFNQLIKKSSNPLKYAHNLYLNDELITDLVIPNSVTSISGWAFDGCSGITKITIPKTVKTIRSNAFACNDKSEVYVEWDDPSDETLSFAQQPFSDAIMQSGKLFVPEGTKTIYEQYDPWRNFFTIEEYTVDGIEEIKVEGGVTIGVEGGKIVVNGAGDAKVEVFGTNGAAVYSGSADSLPELAAGIYIVRVGSTIKKVAVAQ